jgi:EAL domain-containing protein (putative c-di-GMP-specific phosphodiesterase class I)
VLSCLTEQFGIADTVMRAAAIAAGAVRAVFQPICHVDSGEVIGYEALARWRHDGVELSPDVFIPVAARSGLLGALTDHMLDLGCAQLARWSDQLGHQRMRVAVECSAGRAR